MRIALTYADGQVFQHFGHTRQFKIYDINADQILAEQIVDVEGEGHGALGGFLKNLDVDVLICGGIGAGAQNALMEAGILFRGGVAGDADAVIRAYMDGTLDYDPNVQCNHHGEGHTCGHHHGEGHTCGHHHGEGHTCGHHQE